MSDANRFSNPFPEFRTPAGVPRENGKMYFYLTTSSTLSAPYTNAAHTVPAANPQILNANGTFDDDIFLDPAIRYRIVLQNSDATEVWTADPYFDPMQNAVVRFAVYPGDPNGHVAGDEGSPGGTGADVIFDTVNLIIWVCTNTGNAATATWSSTTGQISGAVSFTGVISDVVSADQNNYSPVGLASASEIRINFSGDFVLTGLAGGAAGRIITLVNIGTGHGSLVNLSAASAAGNAFRLGRDLPLDPDDTIVLKYDAISGKWRRFASAPAVAMGPPPMGVLSLTAGQAVMTGGYGAGEANAAATAIVYTPDVGGFLPVPDSAGAVTWLQFGELTLTLNNPGHAAQGIYDVFGYRTAAGRPAVLSGPVWDTAGNYVSAGALTTGVAARGTGATKTQLTRNTTYGFQFNTVDILGRNGATANIALPAGQGIWLGSFWVDATAGQLTCQMLIGQNRKWGLYNAFGRRDRSLLIGDSTAGWSGTSVLRALRGQTANSGSILSGFSEEMARVRTMFTYSAAINGNTAVSAIGIASITVASGFRGISGVGSGTTSPLGTVVGEHRLTPFLGAQAFTHLENADSGTVSSAAAPAGNQMVIDFKA